jgi:hypothetical protein
MILKIKTTHQFTHKYTRLLVLCCLFSAAYAAIHPFLILFSICTHANVYICFTLITGVFVRTKFTGAEHLRVEVAVSQRHLQTVHVQNGGTLLFIGC